MSLMVKEAGKVARGAHALTDLQEKWCVGVHEGPVDVTGAALDRSMFSIAGAGSPTSNGGGRQDNQGGISYFR